jgi:ankyrin repeat protein
MGNLCTKKTNVKLENTNVAENIEVDWKPIHSAIRWNKFEDVKILVINTTAANCCDDKNGNLPIHIAAQNGHFEIIEFLISKGANVNAQNNKGNTALHMAIGYEYYTCANLLLRAGADPELKNRAGIPSKKGIEGDKSIPLIALTSAKTKIEAEAALALSSKNMVLLEKSSFASAGLKVRKVLQEDWTPELQENFKNIVDSLS